MFLLQLWKFVQVERSLFFENSCLIALRKNRGVSETSSLRFVNKLGNSFVVLSLLGNKRHALKIVVHNFHPRLIQIDWCQGNNQGSFLLFECNLE